VSIQHVNIPDGERHEPKGVSLATTGQVYVADGAASGVWRKVKENDLDFTDASANKFGWNYRRDDTYTSGSPLAISSGVKTLFTNDGGGALTDVTRPLGISYSTNSFTPLRLTLATLFVLLLKLPLPLLRVHPTLLKWLWRVVQHPFSLLHKT
jgi:hypothetical protein